MVILGLNTADDKEIARKFMEENGATYPTILDTSDSTWEIISQYETMSMTAVPMTYVIDKEGKVLDAWYGFQEKKFEELPKKLGFE